MLFRSDLAPSYQQIRFAPAEKRGRFRLLAAPEASKDEPATIINQDARLYVGELGHEETVRQVLAPGRHAWVQVVRGRVSLNGQLLNEGDGAAISDEQQLTARGDSQKGGEILLFDLP